MPEKAIKRIVVRSDKKKKKKRKRIVVKKTPKPFSFGANPQRTIGSVLGQLLNAPNAFFARPGVAQYTNALPSGYQPIIPLQQPQIPDQLFKMLKKDLKAIGDDNLRANNEKLLSDVKDYVGEVGYDLFKSSMDSTTPKEVVSWLRRNGLDISVPKGRTHPVVELYSDEGIAPYQLGAAPPIRGVEYATSASSYESPQPVTEEEVLPAGAEANDETTVADGDLLDVAFQQQLDEDATARILADKTPEEERVAMGGVSDEKVQEVLDRRQDTTADVAVGGKPAGSAASAVREIRVLTKDEAKRKKFVLRKSAPKDPIVMARENFDNIMRHKSDVEKALDKHRGKVEPRYVTVSAGRKTDDNYNRELKANLEAYLTELASNLRLEFPDIELPSGY